MHCPVCLPHQELQPKTLVDTLSARVCPSCHGHWVRAEDYRAWRKLLATDLPLRDGPEVSETPGAKGLKRCPEDQRVLARMRVGQGVSFTFDYCRGCEGMWFDAGEWETLVERNLHDDLLQMVFDDWQRDVVQAEKRVREEQQFRRQLSDVDYDRIRDVKAWLDVHPRRGLLYDYLGVQPSTTRSEPRSGSRTPRASRDLGT
jgi:Zn-finger nucleic acid-binding protein